MLCKQHASDDNDIHQSSITVDKGDARVTEFVLEWSAIFRVNHMGRASDPALTIPQNKFEII
jgi:hypothetical protein